jgi:hypothetical protein
MTHEPAARKSLLLSTLPLGALTLISALGLGGCTVTPTPVVGYATISSGPIDIEAYPSTFYEGRRVYLYHDAWWFRDNGRWAYYRSEPPELFRQRRYVQVAPPAPHYYGPGYTQPAPVYPQPVPAPAPPAVRVQ